MLLSLLLPQFASIIPAFIFLFFSLNLQNGHLAAGLAGLDPGSLSGRRPNSSSGVLEHEGHRFGISLHLPCPSLSTGLNTVR